jgi:hypothetical protein
MLVRSGRKASLLSRTMQHRPSIAALCYVQHEPRNVAAAAMINELSEEKLQRKRPSGCAPNLGTYGYNKAESVSISRVVFSLIGWPWTEVLTL